jgi:hypothetical protein
MIDINKEAEEIMKAKPIILAQDSFEMSKDFILRVEKTLNNALSTLNDETIVDVKINTTATESGRQTITMIILYNTNENK